MTIELQPCASCARHVERSTRVCPFCGASAPRSKHVPKNTSARMALVAAAASVVAAEACSSSEALYGAPCVGDGGACGPFVTSDAGGDAKSDAAATDGGADASGD